MKDWSIKQLYEAMQRDLQMCQTNFERINCKAVCGKEIRETAERFAVTRRLTTIEIEIASQFGYRG